MRMSQEQLDSFQLHGFVSCGQVLGTEEVEVLRREYDAEFERAWREDSLRNLSVQEELVSTRSGRQIHSCSRVRGTGTGR